MAAPAQHQLIPVKDAMRWHAATQGLPSLPTLDWCYASALQDSLGDAIALYHYHTEHCELVCPLVLRQHGTCDVATPYGMTLSASGQPDESFAESFNRFAIGQRWTTGYFACDANFQPEAWGLHAATLNPVLRLPIVTDEDLLARMQSNARHELRRWLANSPTICSEKTSIQPWLLAEYPAFLQRIGAAPVYRFTDDTLRKILHSQLCLAVAAVVGGSIEAISLFLYKGQVADYFLNVSSAAGRHHARGLIWNAIGELRERGVTQLNLGGGIRGADSLFAFKKRLGGELAALPVLMQVFEHERFEEACQAIGCQSDGSGYFPPYLHPRAG